MKLEKNQQHYQKEFDSNPIYKKKYLKTEIKSKHGKINNNFQNNKIPK